MKKIQIGAQACIPLELLDKTSLMSIKKSLTIDNPELNKKRQLGLSLFGVQPSLKLYEERDNNLVIPIGYLEQSLAQISSVTKDMLEDSRQPGLPINIDFKGILRPYQSTALESLSGHTLGIISAPTGSGKSIMMCKLIVDKKVETLVLVNTRELANQFKKNLLSTTTLDSSDIKIISAGAEYTPSKVTIALFQSMRSAKYIDDINARIGMVLTDEVHITGATTYYEVLNKLTAKYKYGFSATPERDDGLTPLIIAASGRIRKEIKISEISSNLALPTVKMIETAYYFPFFDMQDYTAMITDLSMDADRNTLIANTIKSYPDQQIVLLCSRVIQCLLLQDLIPNSKILVGNISKEDQKLLKLYFPTKAEELTKQKGIKYRRSVVEELNSKALRIVISTYSLFSTGLDFKDLEIAGFCAPMKSRIQVKQCRGRIMRQGTSKSPICLDFRDSKVGILKTQSQIRQRILKDFN